MGANSREYQRAYRERKKMEKGNAKPERVYRASELIDILLGEYKMGIRGKQKFVIKAENYEKLVEAVERLKGFQVKRQGDALRFLMGEGVDGEN